MEQLVGVVLVLLMAALVAGFARSNWGENEAD
jgi:hypothetical protein